MRKIVVANWKQNKNLKEVKLWLKEFERLVSDERIEVDVVIAPSHPYVSVVSSFCGRFDFLYTSAQDVSVYTDGAHTGEVGAMQVIDYCGYCIVGHSERNEEKDIVYQKAVNCFENGIKPIICFVDYENIGSFYAPEAILVWEDPENISREGVFNPKDSSEIKGALVYMRRKAPGDTTILYGGSVNKGNTKDFAKIDDLDGVLVGSASLDPKHFYEIVEAFNS